MKIARVIDGIVVNLEVGDQGWLDANQGVDGALLIPYTEESPAYLGLGWSEENGFEKPFIPPFVES